MKTLWRVITATKNAVGNIVFLALIILITVLAFSGDTIEVPESAVLRLDPSGVLVEQKQPVDPLQPLLPEANWQIQETLLRDVLDAIELARDDERIKGIDLDLGNLLGGSLSQYAEIGDALEDFKSAGKPVLVKQSGYGQGDYYLASFADEIYLDSDQSMFGGVIFWGFGISSIYMKNAADRFRLKFHVFKQGRYKSAVEPYERENMSADAKQANNELLANIWDEFLDSIALRRQLNVMALRDYIDNINEYLESPDVNPGEVALELGLADAIISRDDWNSKLASLAGTDEEEDHIIGFMPYLGAERAVIPNLDIGTDQIAVIVAQGVILDGDQPPGTIGSSTLARLIRQASDNENTKAIVLRVDSPGGSASASERIRSTLQTAQSKGLPLVVSMGGVAASGGYWISASADEIIASPYTITGSIGVFGVIPKLNEALAEYGINSDAVGTTELTHGLNPMQTMSPQLERLIDADIERTYKNFLQIVGDGRQIEAGLVAEVAEGRAWGSQAALERNLIDGIGNLEDAIQTAAELAETDDYEVNFIEEPLSPWEQFLAEVTMEMASSIVSDRLARMLGMHGAMPPLGLHPQVDAALLDMLGQIREPRVMAICTDCKTQF